MALMRRRGGLRGRSSFKIDPVRGAVGLAVGIFGLWVGSLTLAQALYKHDATRALSLDPRNVNALAQQSRIALENSRTGDANQFARAALTRDATAVGAVQALGITAQMGGDLGLAGRWLNYAQRLSRRDLQTNLWAIEYHVLGGDSATVLGSYDRALRTSVPIRDTLFPILGQTVSDPAIMPDLIEILAKRPPWAADFLAFLASNNQIAPAAATRFLSTVRQHGLNADAASLQVLVSRSFQGQQPDVAWRAYSLKRPDVDPRRLRDSKFANLPDHATLFDWTLADGGNIFVQALTEGGRTTLEVAAGAGAAGLAAQQAQMLPPGDYRLVIAVEEATLADGSLEWTLACSDGAALARLPIAMRSAPSVAATTFRIPTGCSSQLLKLNAYAGDALDGVRARFASASIDAVE